MLSFHAVALTALLSLPHPGYSQLPPGPTAQAPPALRQTVLVIARPEASDIFMPTKTRIRADDLLARNPGLTRAARLEEAPYDLRKAAEVGWTVLRHSELPVAMKIGSMPAAVVPEPATAALMGLASVLLLARRRPQALGQGSSRGGSHHPEPVPHQNSL